MTLMVKRILTCHFSLFGNFERLVCSVGLNPTYWVRVTSSWALDTVVGCLVHPTVWVLSSSLHLGTRASIYLEIP